MFPEVVDSELQISSDAICPALALFLDGRAASAHLFDIMILCDNERGTGSAIDEVFFDKFHKLFEVLVSELVPETDEVHDQG